MRNEVRKLIVAAACAVLMAGVHAADDSDPMRPEFPQRVAAKIEEDYRLSAVFVSNRQRVAVLNGQLVREGQSIGRARVAAIAADHVTLIVDGVERVAQLNQPGTRP